MLSPAARIDGTMTRDPLFPEQSGFRRQARTPARRIHFAGRRLGSDNTDRPVLGKVSGRIAWRDSSGGVYYYFVDMLGSTRVVTDSSGNTCFNADYYPYGQENDYSTSCSPRYKFTGYEYDSETGNYYAYARYYDPRRGRFMSPDPLGGTVGNPQSLNRYAYVLNNPASFVDPWGRDCVLAFDESGQSAGSCEDDSRKSIGSGGGGRCQSVYLDGIYVGTTCNSGAGGGRRGGGGGASSRGGGPGGPRIGPALPETQSLLGRLKEDVCSVVPQGRVATVGGSVGGIGSPTGSVSVVLNYNTGRTSLFATGGMQVGWNGGAQVQVSAGLIYGALGPNSAGYSGEFSTASGSSGEGIGGYASFAQGVQVYGAGVGATLLPTPTAGVAVTETSQPLNVGGGLSNPFDLALFLARQACNW
jgi:RHS repeat-associated protein